LEAAVKDIERLVVTQYFEANGDSSRAELLKRFGIGGRRLTEDLDSSVPIREDWLRWM
jgi:hypothetical protein